MSNRRVHSVWKSAWCVFRDRDVLTTTRTVSVSAGAPGKPGLASCRVGSRVGLDLEDEGSRGTPGPCSSFQAEWIEKDKLLPPKFCLGKKDTLKIHYGEDSCDDCKSSFCQRGSQLEFIATEKEGYFRPTR